ncbi:hypothetical protein G7Y89_g12930 [Cudoniella acicularis]|uniref:Rieske domain-containing protein n=1 Tax=Cudoniella acicularis TaxID=354080 RepID=A0A8H4R965_9HELO|nr:hypothetical protein G7Y89_g12930 [Cudoniella acicularis]
MLDHICKLANLSPYIYSLGIGLLLLVGIVFQSHHLQAIFLDSTIHLRKQIERLPTIKTFRSTEQRVSQPLGGDAVLGLGFRNHLKGEQLFQFEHIADMAIAGFSLIVILGKDKKIRTFQNVCRHRAYQVTKKECGSSTVLGCRYHGWSYDTTGKLIKAPEFENVAAFDKSINGLWEVKTEVKNGMVLVNLDSSSNLQQINLGESETELDNWKLQNLHCIHEWKVNGCFNWKLAGDFSKLQTPKGLKQPSLGLLSRFKSCQKSLRIGWTTVIRHTQSGGLLTLRYLPLSSTTTMVDCCLYTSDPINAEKDHELQTLKESVRWEVKQLEHKHQKEPQKGFDGSISHQELRKLLMAHAEAEKRHGADIQPAARKQNLTAEGQADDAFCRKLEMSATGSESLCSAGAQGLLDWIRIFRKLAVSLYSHHTETLDLSLDDITALNGTDNTIGMTRRYEPNGAYITETSSTLSVLPMGPSQENHALNP